MISPRILLSAATLTAITLAAAQEPVLLKDVNSRPAGSSVDLGSDFLPLGVVPTSPPTLLFSAWTEAAGRELWATQGTASSTQMVADHNPGTASSNPGPIAVLPGVCVLLAMDHPDAGRELHQVALSLDAITLVRDGNPGTEGLGFKGSLEITNGVVSYATTRQQPGGEEVALWRSDGQTADEVFRWPVAPPEHVELDVVGGAAFVAVQGALWKSDGTSAGTFQVPGSLATFPRTFGDYNGDLVFSAEFAGLGRELARSDGTGISLVRDIHVGIGSSNPGRFTGFGDRLYFQADDGAAGVELWALDASGALMRWDINPGVAGSDPDGFASSGIGSSLFFTATHPAAGRELLKLSAPGQPPTLAFDFAPGAGGSSPRGTYMLSASGVYTAATVDGDEQLWGSLDAGGTWNQLTFARQGLGGTRPRNLVGLGSTLLASLDDGQRADEPFLSDGTVAGTALLADVNGPVETTQNSIPLGFVYFRGLTYFRAGDGNTPGLPLWETDGTEQGTRIAARPPTTARLTDIRFLTEQYESHSLVMNGTDIAGTGSELWKYDPATRRLDILKDIAPGAASSDPADFYADPGTGLTFFSASTATTGREPWVTDGTALGTIPLGDLNTGIRGSAPRDFRFAGPGVLLFAADDGVHGEELWRTEGTPSSTQLVADILPGSDGSRPSAAKQLAPGPHYYFGAQGPNGGALYRWSRDRGLELVRDIAPFSFTLPRNMTLFFARIVFTVNAPPAGEELWISDGTAAGTMLLADLLAGGASSQPGSLTVNGDYDKLFFTAIDAAAGGRRSLYVLDRQFAVTKLAEGIQPSELRAVGKEVWCQAFAGRRALPVPERRHAGGHAPRRRHPARAGVVGPPGVRLRRRRRVPRGQRRRAWP